ncbi:MAG: flagellar hook assembly protein FlgD [Deferribacteraceae bacterium]|jgi:flagellar basal-body rod modification protein FlgD|nr:flagellar hook assembly protein FlgD [Deferribacteraceae bacterium]
MQLSKTTPTATSISYEQYKENLKNREDKGDGIGKEAFLNLLVTQLQNQDPLDPMDNAEFTSQTTAFSQLEQMMAINETLTSMLKLQNATANVANPLIDAATFIGKTIEYNSNTLVISDNGISSISFYAADAAASAYVSIYDANGSLVGGYELGGIAKGSNAFTWDGKGLGGVTLPNGTYNFTVSAASAAGDAVTVGTYGEGKVLGIKSANGEVYFELQSGLVPLDTVYSVRE